MQGRHPLPKYTANQTPIKADDLNKLAKEVTRLGKVKASPPLSVTSNAAGVFLSVNKIGALKFGFFKLVEQVNPNGHGKGRPYEVPNPPDGDWTLNTHDADEETLYAPPTLVSGEYYPPDIIVTAAFNSDFQRWVILSSPYCTC